MMKVVEIAEFGAVETLRLSERPEIGPGAGEVRIRVKAAAINPVDYKLRQGRFGGELPMVLGHDLAGVVDAVGAEVDDLKVGDEVWSYLGGPKSNGSYAQWVCVPTSFVSRKPANLTFAQAAAAPLVALTAYEAVLGKARVQAGDSVLVTGSTGGVGSTAIQLCRHLGAHPIVATAGSDRSARYLEETLGIPASHILRHHSRTVEQLEAAVRELNGNRRIHAAFDFVGHRMKHLCLRVVGFGGSVVTIVEEPSDFLVDLFDGRSSPLFVKSASLHMQFLGARALIGEPHEWKVYRQELEALCQLFEAGNLQAPAITEIGSFTAEAIQEAHRRLEAGDVQGKLVVNFEE